MLGKWEVNWLEMGINGNRFLNGWGLESPGNVIGYTIRNK